MKIGTYIKETKNEMKHVSWPTRTQALAFTVITIIIALLTAAYLGLFDYLFTEIIANII
ncbi:MAG: preprotein translocase subunit SecE [Candidatus Pacebacteria bacterium]|nr:preprotein translocase subunit SecE [Candidatus Paceibacterota bacterium]